MERVVNTTRSYSSPLRAAQAIETRRRIVESARVLFAGNGYPTTTIAAIAKHAGVSADTVYGTFGTKAHLLKQLLDTVIGGDHDDVALLERADPQLVRSETDQRRQIALFAVGITTQLERIRPLDDILRSAAAVDPAVAELRTDLQLRQRRDAMRTVVSWVAANGPLLEGITEEDAAAIVWTLTSPEVHQMMRDGWGWTQERFVNWLRDTLTTSLLPPPPTAQ